MLDTPVLKLLNIYFLIYIYIYKYINIIIFLSFSLYIYIYIYLFLSLSIYIYIYIYTYKYIHIYIYIYMYRREARVQTTQQTPSAIHCFLFLQAALMRLCSMLRCVVAWDRADCKWFMKQTGLKHVLKFFKRLMFSPSFQTSHMFVHWHNIFCHSCVAKGDCWHWKYQRRAI
jgi:hypothetical protein